MRPDVLAGGIIIIVMGIIGYGVMKDHILDCITSSSIDSASTYFRQVCEQLKLIQTIAIISAVIGFGMLIYGGIAKKQISEIN
jgi:hypothetical protein